VVLAHRHRRTIYEKLSPILGDEETDAMLAHFPSTPGEEPVTVAVLDARFSEFRAAIEHELRKMAWAVVTVLLVGLGLAATIGAMFGG
jgi:hypothetical protein